MNKATPNLAGMNVLLVDDTPANIDVLRRLLEEMGLNISIALNGEMALKIVSRRVPDLILMDIMMPGMNGFDTCRKLKEYGEIKSTPVIFISAKIDGKDIENIFSAGGVDYITKPFRQEEVFARVLTHLELVKIRRERKQLVEELRALKEQAR